MILAFREIAGVGPNFAPLLPRPDERGATAAPKGREFWML